MKFDVRSRLTGKVQFTGEIECAPDAPPYVKLGLAVRWAIRANADLSGADLRGADLSHMNLSHTNVRDKNLSGADLSRADLSYTSLRGTHLRGTDLSYTDMRYADLRGTDLSHATLRGARLHGTDLSYANLRTDLRETDLHAVDLHAVDLGDAWVIKGASRADGYSFLLTNLPGEGVRVKACGDTLSIDEAVRRWAGSPRGWETALIIALMVEQAKARGLSFDPIAAVERGGGND